MLPTVILGAGVGVGAAALKASNTANRPRVITSEHKQLMTQLDIVLQRVCGEINGIGGWDNFVLQLERDMQAIITLNGATQEGHPRDDYIARFTTLRDNIRSNDAVIQYGNGVRQDVRMANNCSAVRQYMTNLFNGLQNP